MAFLPDGSEGEPETESEEDIVDQPTDETGDWLEEVFADTSDDTEDNDAEDILLPIDVDDVAEGDSDDTDPEDILEPIIEDDIPTVSDGDEGEILEPIDEDDVQNTDDTVVEVASSVDGPEEVENFDSREDVLCIYLNNATEIEEGDVAVFPSKNGEDSKVYVNGKLVAVLKNVNDATAENIFLMQNLMAA
ncbi:MAG: hypothetical protein ACU0CA_04225 [Paracoccaceae bacterium]